MLPLDLHVLGLSLAFILSQDQTLRCKKNYKSVLCPKRSIVVVQIDKGLLSSAAIPYYIYKASSLNTLTLQFMPRDILTAFREKRETRLFLKSGCKGTAFFSYMQIFY